MNEISVVVTMQVPNSVTPFVVDTLRNLFVNGVVDEVRKCPSCGQFFIPRNIADPPGECPTCDQIPAHIPAPAQPGDLCQMLGDGYSRHWAPCADYPEGAVTDINGRVLSKPEANIVLQRWFDQHN